MTTPRLAWADAAKGFAIIGVVLLHVVGKHFVVADWPARGFAVWMDILDVLRPIRIPLFFLISGFFATRAIARPWRTMLRRNSLNLYYLYVLWLVIQTAIFHALPRIDTAVAESPVQFVKQLVYSPSNLWFLFALAVFFVAVKLLRTVPVLALVAAGLLSTAAAASVLPDALNHTALPENLVFFLAGAYLPTLVGFWAERARWWAFLLVAAVFATVLVIDSNWLFLAACASGAATAIYVIAKLSPTIIGAGLTVVGRKTLPIYVMQMPMIAAVAAFADDVVPDSVASSLWFAIFYPLILTAAIIALALAVHRVLSPVAPVLFRAPWLLGERTRPSGEGGAESVRQPLHDGDRLV